MAMSHEERKSIEAAGFVVTTVDAFLGLTPEESARVDRLATAEIQGEQATAEMRTKQARRSASVSRKRLSAA